ncbi:FAD:protein FMN transferase [Paenibacillus sp. P25]|nr:FAD:protein FMN transferase [Paenibacillus sp. P25]
MKPGVASYTIRRFRAMNTDVEAVLQNPAESLAGEAEHWFAYAESTFSRFRPDSELSRLNRSGGRPCFVSRTMMEVLQLADSYRTRTMGLFEPLILPALEQAGYTDSFERLPVPGTGRATGPFAAAEAVPELRPAGYAWTLDPRLGAVRSPEGGRVDLGGIVKGWTVDRVASWFRGGRRVPAGLINAGGDLSVWGGTPVSPWKVEVADPREGTQTLANVLLTNGAAATSSILGRRWAAAGGVNHHLIDPRTMAPARRRCGAVHGRRAECRGKRNFRQSGMHSRRGTRAPLAWRNGKGPSGADRHP